jgi:hypothetical protein
MTRLGEIVPFGENWHEFIFKKILALRVENILRQVQDFIPVSKTVWPGANPTIASYNASVVEVYSAVNSMARF